MWARRTHRKGLQKCAVKLPGPTATGQAAGAPTQRSPVVDNKSGLQSAVVHDEGTKPEYQRLIGPNNKDHVNGEMYKALIDSGSQITSITEDMWKTNPKLQDRKLTAVDVSIEGAGGQTVPHLGVIPISLRILDVLYSDVPAFVVQADSYRKQVPVLIGTNVIQASKRDQQIAKGQHFMQQVKAENRSWHTAYTNVAVSDLGDQHRNIGYAKYVGRFPRIIPSGAEDDIICEAPRSPGNQPYTAVIESFPHSQSCLKVGSIITDIGPNRRVPVRLCNLSAKPITITRNCKLARLSSVLRTAPPQLNLQGTTTEFSPSDDSTRGGLETSQYPKMRQYPLSTCRRQNWKRSNRSNNLEIFFATTQMFFHCLPSTSDAPLP